ncbi:MAG: S-layer homology domain-containing protein [Acutalibacter sp.]|jgi:exopolysaccharide biosynthesis protein
MKKNGKRLVSALLCALLLCMAIPLQAAAASFSDVSWSAWYRPAVNALADKGILSGTGGNRFSPNATLTRAEFVTMLAKSTLSSGELSQYNFRGSFKDVSTSNWCNAFVNWAYETGVATGYSGGTFLPNKYVTRQEMAVMIKNLAQSTGRKFPALNSQTSFQDQSQIASWAKDAVKLCRQAGVINGDAGSNRFRPTQTATRAEAASICYQYLNNCKTDGYSISRKRVNGVACRAVIFSPDDFKAGLVMGQDMVDGRESVTSLIKRTGATIAVNGAFFNMDNYIPLGTLIGDGRVLTVDNLYAPAKSSLVMSPSGDFSVENFSTLFSATLKDANGKEVAKFDNVGMNKWPNNNYDATRMIMTRDWGTKLNFSTRDAVVVDANGTITNMYTYASGNVDIPQGGFVLCQKARRQYEGNFFDSCKVGMTISVDRVYRNSSGGELPFDPVISIGAGPRIVKDGKVYGSNSTYQAEGFTSGLTSGNAVRVCAGIRANGDLVILQATTSVKTLSQIMVTYGCQDAVNFDGGGSANLYVDGTWLYGPQSRLLNNMLYFTR